MGTGNGSFSGATALKLGCCLVLAACSGTEQGDGADRYAGQRVEMEPAAVVSGSRNKDGQCVYTWLTISGRVDGKLATSFAPFRNNMGADQRCRPSLSNEISALIQAEIDDGDRETIALCVKEMTPLEDVEVPAGTQRYEAVEIMVSGWYFTKPAFWTCNDEPGCPPPDSCNLNQRITEPE